MLLNPLKAPLWEVVDLLMRGIFLAVLVTNAVTDYWAGEVASFVFFLLSRLWIVLLWTIFVSALFLRPDRAEEEEEGGPPREEQNRSRPQHHHNHHHLSKLIKYEVLSSSAFRATVFSMVAVCGLLDLSILRLLTWLPTEFSKYAGGYPDLFSLRCCVYGSNVSLVLQCIASIVLLAKGGGGGGHLSAISMVLSMFLMLKTFTETISAVQKERSAKMVTVLELDKHLLRSLGSMQATASIEMTVTATRDSCGKGLGRFAGTPPHHTGSDQQQQQDEEGRALLY